AAREGRDLYRDLVAEAGMHPAARARVLALGVLAHDDPVDRAAFVQRRGDARQDASRPHVRVLVEALTDRQTQAPERNVIRHVGRADRAEEDGVESLQLLQPALRDVAPGLLVAFRAPVEMLELQPKAVGGALEHLHARGNDFGADAIAGNGGDPVGLQAAIMRSAHSEGEGMPCDTNSPYWCWLMPCCLAAAPPAAALSAPGSTRERIRLRALRCASIRWTMRACSRSSHRAPTCR